MIAEEAENSEGFKCALRKMTKDQLIEGLGFRVSHKNSLILGSGLGGSVGECDGRTNSSRDENMGVTEGYQSWTEGHS